MSFGYKDWVPLRGCQCQLCVLARQDDEAAERGKPAFQQALVQYDPAIHDPTGSYAEEAERATRKATPIAGGVLAYFPDALALVARVSKVGNDQHNPGQPMHWAREKSTDEADALARHLLDFLQGEHYDTDGVPHVAKIAWRALALAQRWSDGEYEGGYKV